MTTSTDVEVNDGNTASSEAAARREAEVVRIFATRQLAGENEAIPVCIWELQGVIGSHRGESLCLFLEEVKIIMSTTNKRWN